MASSWRKAYIRCPYYQGDDERRIHCEGIIPQTNAGFWFRTKAGMEQHADRYCQAEWKRCPYAAALGAKYDEA